MEVIYFKSLSFRLTKEGARTWQILQLSYLRTKIKKKWVYRKVSEDRFQVAVGEYHLIWYIKKRKAS